MSSDNSKIKIFVTRKIPQPGLDMLKEHYEVIVNPITVCLVKMST